MKLKAVKFLVTIAVLNLLCCGWASAGPDDANNLVCLNDYLRWAALHSAALAASFEQWKGAIEQVPVAESLPDPKFTYGYFIEEVETRVGPQRQKAGIMQVFPWFGKIESATDAAASAARSARKRYEAEKLELFYRVKEVFHEYSYLSRAVEIAGQNLELLKHFEEVARTRYMAAAGSHPDVIRAQVELAELEEVLTSLEQLRGPLAARLNAVLNRRNSGLLPWPKREEVRDIRIGRKELVALLRKMNPELAALDFDTEAARHRLELAKKEFWPDVGVGVDWIETGGAVMPGVGDSGKDPVVLMFSMNLPVWRDKYKAAERQAKADARKTSHQKIEAENMLMARAEQVLYELEESRRKMGLYGDVLTRKAEELLRASESAYRSGAVDFLSLIDAQRMLLKFELDYERAVTDSQQRLAELEMLAGTEFPGAEEKALRE